MTTELASSDRPSEITVAHMREDWLPLSENWLHSLLTHLPDGVKNRVVCERALNLDKFPVDSIHVTMTSRWLRSLAFRRGLGKFVRRYARADVLRSISPHIMHSHFGQSGWESVAIARRLRVPHIVSFYGYDVNLPDREDRWRRRYREMFDQASAVLCEGPHMMEQIIAHGARREQMRLFRLGIALDRFPYRPRTWARQEPLRVLIAGRFVEKKGMPYAIDALARIASRIPLEIHLVGDAYENAASQAEKLRITEAIERGGLADRVVSHGMIPYGSLIELAYRCHVFVSPSVRAADGDTEGGAPVAIAEMAASGMPIVSTTHCDIPYAVGGSDNAMLAPERDADALADLLLKLVENPGSWRPMLDRARAHVENNYEIIKQGGHLAQIYREVISSQPKTDNG
ncbi:glycosyltransferase [Bradyrhizobium canariense]|uniref:Colanic acid/amylovoran biosynthesis glycosyltransferase n=1 Tax=Bradyrhizobium canariense TaxID=255045 RepID=A0A1H2BP98_9BRAD|nr:glycosyltransferase [Bradyrhizobium canariense]SDT59586.1 colanic acid/amylovoran biosynthesis glycosyltransferase [Bradyrhizobium canariense]